jgi:hypothetical protein
MTALLWWTTTALAGGRTVPDRPVDCPGSPVAVVRQYATDVETAYDKNDIVGFDAAAEALVRVVGCVDEPLDPASAIALHHAMGLRAFAARDLPAAARSLRAIRYLDPAWRPSSGWMEDGQPIYALYREELPRQEITVPERSPGELRVDGRTTNLVPANEAYVLQLVDRQTALYTGYHLTVTTLPAFGTTDQTRRVVHTVGTSVGVAVLGGALISELAAANARTALRDPATPTAELAGLYSRANTLETVAVGLGIGSAATIGFTWVIPW